MKCYKDKYFSLIFFVISLSFFVPSGLFGQAPRSINVMSFNIRYPNPQDGFNYWPNRKEMVASMIRFNDADIIGVQEAFRSQLDDLMKLLPEFNWLGVCRTDGSIKPEPDNEFSAIIYRKDRFEILKAETFWLSETTSKPGSKSWDAALPRIVTWAHLLDKKTKKKWFHFNTHFDHRGKIAREKSASIIIKKIKEIARNNPTILTGDFNCKPEDLPYQILVQKDANLKDAINQTETPHHGPMSTWTNSFQFPGAPGQRIDFIFVNDKIRVLKHAILSDSWSGRLPSDHLPVFAKVLASQ